MTYDTIRKPARSIGKTAESTNGTAALIDKKALFRELKKSNDMGKLSAKSAIRKVMEAPVIDALPVVRCSDCKNFLENWRCLKWSAFARPEGYCYKAERKKYEKG